MIATKRFADGAWVIAAIIRGYFVRRTYIGFTKREAVSMFRRDTK